MEGKTLKNCSTSKDAEADHDGVNNPTDPLQKAKRELETKSDPKKKQKTCEENSENEEDSLEPKSERKEKTSEEKEMQNLRKSFKEMTAAVKKLQEKMPYISIKEKETPKKEEEHDCCMESHVLEGEDTILVKEHDCSKRELDNLETKSDPKKKHKTCEEKSEDKEDSLEPKSKTSEDKEMQKLRKSFKEMADAVKILQKSLLIKADMPVLSFLEKETPKKEEEEEHDCCLEFQRLEGPNDEDTIFVKGFDDSLPRGDIKSALWEHFSSCGVVTRVFVPFECKTGASVGFAFIDLEMDSEKAVTLHGSLLKGWTLEVMMAITTPEYDDWRNSFRGCQRCISVLLNDRRRSHAARRRFMKIR